MGLNPASCVAALYDIHANFPALQAVLAEVREAGADLIVVGGDIVPGPMPRETIRCLESLDIPVRFVRGNGDREVAACMEGSETRTLPEQALEAIRWTAGQLTPEQGRWLTGLPAMIRVELHRLGEVLFCHATPRNDTEIFTRHTPAEHLLPVFKGAGTSVVVCGHTHMPFDRDIGGIRIVNAGSVGMPFGQPGANWALLGPNGVELRHTRYDLAGAADLIRSTTYPQADDFATNYVLNPPSEETMLGLFSRMELK